jgi:peptide chain release factor 2
MITNDQIKELQQRVETLGRCISVEEKRAEVEEKTQKTLAPDFWDDPKAAEKFLKELSGVKFWVTGFDKASGAVEDLNVLLELEDDDIDQAYEDALKEVESLELRNMLGEEGDNLGAVLTINSGAGGTEANDWSAMLMRMYMRWAERNGYKVTVTDELEGEDAGIKSVTMQVEGDYAFGYLKAESGVHRLVRISMSSLTNWKIWMIAGSL